MKEGGRTERHAGQAGAMRRIAHYLFTVSSVVSLLLLVAVAWAWIRSWSHEELLVIGYVGTDQERVVWLNSARNIVGVVVFIPDFPPATLGRLKADALLRYGTRHGGWNVIHRSLPPERYAGSRPFGDLLRFNAATFRTTQPYDPRFIEGADPTEPWLIVPVRDYRAYFPFWVPTLVLAILPSVKLVGVARSRLRPRAGHCAGCGYDLTGNASGVCPECGKPILSESVEVQCPPDGGPQPRAAVPQ